jgi:hypothetical protein
MYGEIFSTNEVARSWDDVVADMLKERRWQEDQEKFDV